MTPGVRDITVSSVTGSNVACQLDETKPCSDVRRKFFKSLTLCQIQFALARFAGNSYLAFTVSADIRSSVSIDSSQDVNSLIISAPILIRGQPGVQIDCQGTRCFTITNVQANPWSLVNVTLVNAKSSGDGGAILATNSVLILQDVTKAAQLRGVVLFLQGSSLQLIHSHFTNNSASSGGAIFAQNASSLTVVSSSFQYNVAATVGGAIVLIASTIGINTSTFQYNSLETSVSNAATLIAGGAVSAVDCSVSISGCSFNYNAINGFGYSGGYGGGCFGLVIRCHSGVVSWQSRWRWWCHCIVVRSCGGRVSSGALLFNRRPSTFNLPNLLATVRCKLVLSTLTVLQMSQFRMVFSTATLQ